MLTVKEVYEAIDAFAPFASQESWDNSGLLVGGMAQPADRILTTLDISEAIVAQAVAEQVQLVVAHHPVIFSPLKTLPPDSPVYQLAAHGIAAICVHTPLDMAPLGLNTFAHTLLEKPLALQGTQEGWSRRGRTAEASGGSTPVPAHGHRKRWHRRCKRHSGKCGTPPQSVPFGKLPTVPARLRPCWNWLRQRAVTL